MYRTCLSCFAPLGQNELIEAFPVGRRLAFDGARGRLWVICTRCRRWNLSVLQERWEAIEECDRLFHDVPTRRSTPQVGLAVTPEGTQLVRVGQPLRSEFAAWRYGSQIARRSLRRHAGTAGWFTFSGGLAASLVLFGPNVVPLTAIAGSLGLLMRLAYRQGTAGAALSKSLLALAAGSSEVPKFQGAFQSAWIQVDPERPDGWQLKIHTVNALARDPSGDYARFQYVLRGRVATRAVGALLSAYNRAGGTDAQVREAVTELEFASSAERYFAIAEQQARKRGRGYNTIDGMPLPVRLALEMAANEETEERALAGELRELEHEWKVAEEVAAIADQLTSGAAVEAALDRLRAEVPPAA